MRRGTEAAKHFGAYLRKRRTDKGLTIAQIAERLGTYSATVSQMELAVRSVKKEMLDDFAAAYEIGPKTLHKVWKEVQTYYPEEPIKRTRTVAVSPDTLEELISKLGSNDRQRVYGYVEALLEKD